MTEADEAPVITSGYGTIYYAENGTGTVGTYVAEDPERETIEWTLSGSTDDGLFTIDGGQLKFKTPPDFEGLNSSDGNNNTYNVTVQAGDGTDRNNRLLTMAVVVMVDNVDEAGTVSGMPERPKEDVQITAVLSDPDTEYISGSCGNGPGHHRGRGLSRQLRKTGTRSTTHPPRKTWGNTCGRTRSYTDEQGSREELLMYDLYAGY